MEKQISQKDDNIILKIYNCIWEYLNMQELI